MSDDRPASAERHRGDGPRSIVTLAVSVLIAGLLLGIVPWAVVVMLGEEGGEGAERPRELRYGLLREDIERIEQTFPEVSRSVPAKIIPVRANRAARSMDVRLVGTTAEWFELVAHEVARGRVLNEGDVERAVGVCVLGEAAARRLLETEDGIGRTIEVGGGDYLVVGVVGGGERSGKGGSERARAARANDVYIPITTARERLGETITERSSGALRRETVELNQIIVELDGESGR